MAELRTEEEQIAAIKEWWKNNGNSILIAIAGAIAIAFGWKAYQSSVLEAKSEASAMYEQLLAAATNVQIAGVNESNGVEYLAGELKDKFDGTEYAIFASLFLAKEKAQAGDLEAAKSELNWALANTEDTRTQDIVSGRLARINSALGEHEAALALLTAKNEDFKSDFLEIEGDIKLRMGQKEAAVEAYKAAYALVQNSPQVQPLLAVKLANLGVDVEEL